MEFKVSGQVTIGRAESKCFFSSIHDNNNELVTNSHFENTILVLVTNRVCLSCLPKLEENLTAKYNRKKIQYLIVLNSSPLELKQWKHNIISILNGQRTFYHLYNNEDYRQCNKALFKKLENIINSPSPSYFVIDKENSKIDFYNYEAALSLMDGQ